MDDNVLGLENPELWNCAMKHLAKGHGLNRIILRKKGEYNNPLFLEFTHVEYYAGWTVWRGANLRVARNDEYLEKIRDIMPEYTETPQDELLKMSWFSTTDLFIFDTVNTGSIYVVANAWGLVDKDGKLMNDYTRYLSSKR